MNRQDYNERIVGNFDPEFHGDHPGQLGWKSGVYLGNIRKKKNAVRSRCNLKAYGEEMKAFDFCCKVSSGSGDFSGYGKRYY